MVQVNRTWLLERYCLGHVLHEDAALELQLWLSVLCYQGSRRHFVFWLVDINLFAAEQNHLKEIDFVLKKNNELAPKQ